MKRVRSFGSVLAVLYALSCIGNAQDKQPHVVIRAPLPLSPASPNGSTAFPPLKDPATLDQIHEYLRLSGDMESFRSRWIAALDKNRSIGAPYWPESFWTALKTEMQKIDLMPTFVTFYQHSISKELMQEILDTYHTLGTEHFQGSPACFKLGDAELAMTTDMDKLKLAKTQEVISKVYTIYKPEIKAAREGYQAEHPDWVDK
jgi:hypothetical protein